MHRAYREWKEARLFELWRVWDEAIRAINPDSCLIPNTGGGATSPLDMKRSGELAPMLVADRQARRGLMPPWAIGMNAKEYRAVMGRKPVVGLFSVGVEEPYRWKDSVQNGAEIRLWVADLVANGMRPWFTKFAATIHDPRWLKPVEDVFQWCQGAEPYLRNERPLARVGLVYSQQTAWLAGGERIRERVLFRGPPAGSGAQLLPAPRARDGSRPPPAARARDVRAEDPGPQGRRQQPLTRRFDQTAPSGRGLEGETPRRSP